MQAAHTLARIRIVQSRNHPRVKELRAALRRSGKTASGLIAIEGEHLLAEAVRSRCRLHTVFMVTGRQACLPEGWVTGDTELIQLSPEVFASASATESPQGWAALVEPPALTAADIFTGASPLLLVLAGVQDPGNLGTLARSAEAFGAAGLLCLPGTAQPWNGKALRASAGSLLRVPAVPVDTDELWELLAANQVTAAAAVPRGGEPVPGAELTGSLALLIGSEGAGLPENLLQRSDRRLTLRCPGPVESLNAGVAGSLLLYEAARQRSADHRLPDLHSAAGRKRT